MTLPTKMNKPLNEASARGAHAAFTKTDESFVGATQTMTINVKTKLVPNRE